MPDRERKRVPDHGSDVLKGSLPEGPPAQPRNKAYPGILGRANSHVNTTVLLTELL